MSDAAAQDATTSRAIEEATLASLFAAAQCLQAAAAAKAPQPSRFLLESARSMAQHTRMADEQLQALLPAMARWQMFLPSALGTDIWDYAAVRIKLPHSFKLVHAALQALESRPQVVATAFHMAAFPLLTSLIGAAWRDLHSGPLHVLVASRNLGWLRFANSRWVLESAVVLSTSPAGLRQMLAGLESGTIRRLLIMVDGPCQPGPRGTQALAGISSALGFRTSILTRIRALGIPVQPFTHVWEHQRLVVTARQCIGADSADASDGVASTAALIEELLLHHPEQWLNWGAARICT